MPVRPHMRSKMNRSVFSLRWLSCPALLLMIALSTNAFAHGMTEADKQAMLDGGYFQYGVLGAKHMLTGYDHLLFLFGVMFFLTRFRDILKFITAFTVGHCITLIFATLMQISANYFLIDAVIALTVSYKGFENIDGFRKYLDVKAPNLLPLVGIFGLIHGFGLSARVQTLPLGEGAPFILRILSFNVGVEVGQIIALTFMLTALSAWRHTVTLAKFTKFSAAANTGLIAAGMLLFLMQLHGWSHTSDPDAFGFPVDEHSHAHAEMYATREAVAPPSAKGLDAAMRALGEQPSVERDSPLGRSPDEQDARTDNPQEPWRRPPPKESQ